MGFRSMDRVAAVRPRPRIAAAWVACLALLPLLSACSSPDRLQVPVGQFLAASNRTAAATRPYITNLNREERNYRFFEARLDPAKDLNRETWAPFFTPEGIQVRLRMFDVIDTYIARLGEVANSKAGAQLATSTNALGGELATLGDRLNHSGDSALSRYAEPLAKLIGAIGEMWVDAERERVLQVAVVQAAPQVDTILSTLENEVGLAYDDRIDNLNLQIAKLVNTYNARRIAGAAGPAWTEDERRVRLGEIAKLIEQREELAANPPSDLFATMRRTHDKLVEAAQKRSPETYAEFAAAVDLFSRRAETVVSATRDLSR